MNEWINGGWGTGTEGQEGERRAVKEDTDRLAPRQRVRTSVPCGRTAMVGGGTATGVEVVPGLIAPHHRT